VEIEIKPSRRISLTMNANVPAESQIVFGHLDKRFTTIGDWSDFIHRSKSAEPEDDDESPRVREIVVSGRPLRRELKLREAVVEYNIKKRILATVIRGLRLNVWGFNRWELTAAGDWTKINLRYEYVLKKFAAPFRFFIKRSIQRKMKRVLDEFVLMLRMSDHVFSSEELSTPSQPTCAYPEGWTLLMGPDGLHVGLPPEPEEVIPIGKDFDLEPFMDDDFEEDPLPSESKLKSMNKQELIDLAEERGLDTMGTKAVLIKRIIES